MSRGKTATETPTGTIGRAKRVLKITDQPFNRYEAAVTDQNPSELIMLQRKLDEPQRRNKQKRYEKHEIVTERMPPDRRSTRMRKSSTLKLKEFDGSTPVEVFLQQFQACSHYYEWNDEECCLQLRGALSGDAAILILSQSDKLSFNQLRRLLRERYGSEKQEEKFQAELRNRRRRVYEDLPKGRCITINDVGVGVSRGCFASQSTDNTRCFSDRIR